MEKDESGGRGMEWRLDSREGRAYEEEEMRERALDSP